jgi:hypothetical protein
MTALSIVSPVDLQQPGSENFLTIRFILSFIGEKETAVSRLIGPSGFIFATNCQILIRESILPRGVSITNCDGYKNLAIFKFERGTVVGSEYFVAAKEYSIVIGVTNPTIVSPGRYWSFIFDDQAGVEVSSFQLCKIFIDELHISVPVFSFKSMVSLVLRLTTPLVPGNRLLIQSPIGISVESSRLLAIEMDGMDIIESLDYEIQSSSEISSNVVIVKLMTNVPSMSPIRFVMGVAIGDSVAETLWKFETRHNSSNVLIDSGSSYSGSLVGRLTNMVLVDMPMSGWYGGDPLTMTLSIDFGFAGWLYDIVSFDFPNGYVVDCVSTNDSVPLSLSVMNCSDSI